MFFAQQIAGMQQNNFGTHFLCKACCVFQRFAGTGRKIGGDKNTLHICKFWYTTICLFFVAFLLTKLRDFSGAFD